ncbi:hypothetical protein Tco_0606519 [Tanacetum coccineum]
MNRRLSSLESLFCYDKAIPEEIIEKPVGLSLGEKNIGNKTRCPGCEAKGVVLCATCSGSGLYVDSIMESQGIILRSLLSVFHNNPILCVVMEYGLRVEGIKGVKIDALN